MNLRGYAMLEDAFEALKTFDWGADPKVLKPIDDAIVATYGDAAGRRELENKLLELLKSDVSRAAKDFICRKLRVIGTAASVPVLAGMLTDPENAHMARYALERMECPEAAQALRDALPKVNGALKIGVIGSLGARQDAASVPALAALMTDSNPGVARAAVLALGNIRTAEAAQALTAASVAPEVRPAVADAMLACAEALLAAGNKVQAMALYKKLMSDDQPKHVRLAATRGMLVATGKSE
ncbi:MAG TPA: HEAT repeat domain-containing protein [Thermogutta sp.]|nr:HEAT repeat domain-containing protein [Thermogutta sp.]